MACIPSTGNSTLVEFTLAAEGDGTRLTVVETGFAGLDTTPEQRKRNLEQQHRGLAARAG